VKFTWQDSSIPSKPAFDLSKNVPQDRTLTFEERERSYSESLQKMKLFFDPEYLMELERQLRDKVVDESLRTIK
jgi:hypothetical protein